MDGIPAGELFGGGGAVSAELSADGRWIIVVDNRCTGGTLAIFGVFVMYGAMLWYMVACYDSRQSGHAYTVIRDGCRVRLTDQIITKR